MLAQESEEEIRLSFLGVTDDDLEEFIKQARGRHAVKTIDLTFNSITYNILSSMW